MKIAGIMRVTRKLKDPPVASGTDWTAVDGQTDADIHAAALTDSDAQPLPVESTQGLNILVNVKKLRQRLNVTQAEFAATYRIPLGTLRDWEQRRKHPDAPARAYLMVISANPTGVAALLRAVA
jgi:putative transcriptional regulator